MKPLFALNIEGASHTPIQKELCKATRSFMKPLKREEAKKSPYRELLQKGGFMKQPWRFYEASKGFMGA